MQEQSGFLVTELLSAQAGGLRAGQQSGEAANDEEGEGVTSSFGGFGIRG
jgi:hypothetical protein